MYTVLLVIHTLVILFLIGIILIQRSDSDGLSGLSGGGGNLLSGRTAGNVLTRTTFILAAIFIATSLTLAIMSGHMSGRSIIDAVPESPAATENAPVATPQGEPQPDAAPAVPKPE